MRASNEGSSLLEVAIGMGIALILGSSALKLLNDQTAIIRSAQERGFITRDGATLQSSMTKLLQPADLCTVHTTLAAAQAGTGAVRTGGSFLRLWSSTTANNRVIGFTSNTLGVYNQRANATWAAVPDWNLSRSPTAVSFDSTSGVIVTTVTWPGGTSNSFGVEGLR